MATNLLQTIETADSPKVECGQCWGQLPLRMSQLGEHGAVWLCAECRVPYVSLCLREQLHSLGAMVRLDERYFDTDGLPPISNKLRREVARLAERSNTGADNENRGSERVSHSLVIPAVKLNASLNPMGNTFQVMVANVSREGLDMVCQGRIDSEYVALKLPLDEEEPVQVVVRLIREQELHSSLREFGGEFFVRLGSVAEEDLF